MSDIYLRESVRSIVREFYEEDSIADKIYAKKLGILSNRPEGKKVDGELIGFIEESVYGKKYMIPIAVYKNPRTIIGLGYGTRGILLESGDFYVAKTSNALHDELINFLIEKKILPVGTNTNYTIEMPRNYLGVIREGYDKVFHPASFYDIIPDYYRDMMYRANQMGRGYKFLEGVEN
jgi:hypothetical protein